VDVRMPVKNGAEVTEEILRQRPGTKVLVITAYPDDPLATRALKAGAVGMVRKPFEIARVLDFLDA
jgi:FixJ family two-component response regulator